LSLSDYQCWNFAQTNDIRHIYLPEVNKLRQEIAAGTAKNLPQGKNIYKLFWDCILENYAQEAADECKEPTKVPKELSFVYNSTTLTTCNPLPFIKQQIKHWWGDVALGTDAAFQPGLENFAVLANGLATRIGCAQKNCDGVLHMVCVVYGKAATTGQAIYEVGAGCSGDNECTTYEGSKCLPKKKFCVAGYPTSAVVVPPTFSKFRVLEFCPNAKPAYNGDPARTELLTMHNNYRAAVAKGEVVMGNNAKARPCPRMKKFDSYDCNLEESAYNLALKCADPNVENVNWHLSSAKSKKLAAVEAMEKWYNEIMTGHMEQKTGSQNLLLPQLNIRNFARMVWDFNTQMGCGIAKCSDGKWSVVCQYGQGVGKYGNTIYFMGPTCNQCGGKTSTQCKDGAFCP
ncbi:SCP-like protein, partial [Ancylostoma caninum]